MQIKYTSWTLRCVEQSRIHVALVTRGRASSAENPSMTEAVLCLSCMARHD